MIVMLDHIGVVAHTIEEAMETLDSRLGFPWTKALPHCRTAPTSPRKEPTTTCSKWAKAKPASRC